MTTARPTGLGDAELPGKLSLFRPPQPQQAETPIQISQKIPVSKPGKPPQKRLRTTLDLTWEALQIIQELQPQKVFCSAMGKKALVDHYHREDWPYQVVESGQTIQLGKKSVQFIETRMLHWPDSMFSYLNEEQLLFSQDAFGMHYASLERFADDCDPAILAYEAATYYANIILPYSALVLKLIGRVTAAKLSFRIIAPDHGPIWRQETGGIISSYAKWAAQKPEAKAVVVYATMWRSTERMARWMWSRFSASSKTTERGPSRTSSVISSPRCAGRQCMTIVSALPVFSSSLPFTW